MACSVYCLVCHPEQLDPLVERLWDAGVASEDIAVVVRRGGDFPPHFSEASCFIQAFWDLSVTSALALGWPVALYAGMLRGRAANSHAVIPLSLYRAWRK